MFLLEQQKFLTEPNASKSRASFFKGNGGSRFLQKKQWFLSIKMLLTSPDKTWRLSGFMQPD
jgi:hypothetical protein